MKSITSQLILAIIFSLFAANQVQAQNGFTFNAYADQEIVDTLGTRYVQITFSIQSTGTDFILGQSNFILKLDTNVLSVNGAFLYKQFNFSSAINGSNHYKDQTIFQRKDSGEVGVTVNTNPGQMVGVGNVLKTTQKIAAIRIPVKPAFINTHTTISWSRNKVVNRVVNGSTSPVITAFGTFHSPLTLALPVELVSFTVQNNGSNNTLSWVTASEKNNSHFEVEYSTNGTEWNVVGIVEGNGTSTARHNYSFSHYKAAGPSAYYRLRQIDYNGEFEYSPVRYVSASGENNLASASLSPNPATDVVEIAVRGYNGQFNAIFYNSMGNQTGVYQSSSNSLVVPVSNMKSGVYIVNVTSLTGEVLDTQRLVIR